MATMIVTKDSGGAGRSEDMTVVLPSQEVPVSTLRAIGKHSGLDGLIVADVVSALAMHERVAARFARAAAGQSQVGELRKIHEALVQIYTSHVDTLEALLKKFALPRGYVSPAGRMAAYLAQSVAQASLLAGSVRAETMEFILLDVAVTLAERSLATTDAMSAVAAAGQPSSTTTALTKAVKSLATGKSTLQGLRAVHAQCLVAVVTKTP